MNNIQLLHEIETLPPELQKQAADFVMFLKKQQQKQEIKQRSIGEYRDKIRIADDFDEPLSDVFG